uniref:Uncharacterized protein LOC104226005 n=1 Tax=Nicotiana sylvestris TaxID=4096 RepID=A0A1U7WG07_NICSY|nr:PREDICTED: uncharacterized protein LOC104226005 [Nicotiana sylvestris]
MEARTSKMVNLNGTNYHLWRNKMKDLLFVTKMHLPVFSSQKPEDKSDEDWEFEHNQVCGYIRQFVEDNVYNHISGVTHARSLWDKLEELYASKTGNNKLFYLTKLMQVKYVEGTTVADHLNEIQGIVDQLSGMGIKFDDEVLALMVLATLPESWETLKVSITNSEIYMEQPDGFQQKGKEDCVCRLRKSLYGLKQAPRQWYKKFESVMGQHGYKKTTSDHCVFA